mgnify:CR=1 FL=1
MTIHKRFVFVRYSLEHNTSCFVLYTVAFFLFTLIRGNDEYLFSEAHARCGYKFISKLHIASKNLISLCIFILVFFLKCVSSIVSLLQNCFLYMILILVDYIQGIFSEGLLSYQQLALYDYTILFGAFTLLLSQSPSFHSLRHFNLLSIMLCLGYSVCGIAGSIVSGKQFY